jgi:hypothetical protein
MMEVIEAINKRTFVKSVCFILIIIALLVGCNGTNNDKRKVEPLPDVETIFLVTASSLREIAWNQLSQEEKSSVMGDWKNAAVTIVQRDEVPIKKTSIKPESIYKVTFHTNKDELLGPIGIYFDPETKEIIAYDIRM